MRTIYHEFESLEHLVASRLLPGGGDHPIRFVVFGGTGAVGGAAVLELCRIILLSQRCRERPWRGEIYATGLSDKEISKFAGRLFLALGREHRVEQVEQFRHYRIDDCIDLHFSILHLVLPRDLREHTLAARDAQGEDFDPEIVLSEYFHDQPKPFLEFVEGLGESLLHAVAVAIPLPSVATYTLGAIDRLAAELGGIDPKMLQRIKGSYLRSFIRGLAVIQQRHARRVMMAHTTAVGGMYRVDGGEAEIRLGFAHSALGKKLVDKKYFADTLTQLYIDHGFHVLVTAAAIGIDAVDFETTLPLDRGIRRSLLESAEACDPPPVAPEALESGDIRLFAAHDLPFGGADQDPEGEQELLHFGEAQDLTVDAAIRSGENGLFSVANCVALYNVMKVAIPEELAMVLVRFAVFGPERRRDWFQDKVCYYTETDNSHLALRILDSYPQLQRSHLGAFATQAYQALGSSTHQARLHELGLVMLMLRLKELGESFESFSAEDLAEALTDFDEFFWRRTRVPTYEDLETLDTTHLSELLGRLCEVDGAESAGRLLGSENAVQNDTGPERKAFLERLATEIRRYLATITSLGIPILYRNSEGKDRVLVGPYAAPLDRALTHRGDLQRVISEMAQPHGVAPEVMCDWVIANCGFVDLRPHALANAAQEPSPQLGEQMRRCESSEELAAWLDELSLGDYFTTCGLTALRFRLDRLYGRVRQRQISLGTQETWKHLFPQDEAGRHLLVPGLIETVRMYSEGLGKVTGTEALWPGWGY